MEIIILLLSIVNAVMIITVMIKINGKNTESSDRKEIEELRNQIEFLNHNNAESNRTLVHNITILGDSLRNSMNMQQENQHNDISEKLAVLESEFDKVRESILISLEKIRTSNIESIEKMRNENQAGLDRISSTINDRLQKSLDEMRNESSKNLKNLDESLNRTSDSILVSLEKIRTSNIESMEKMRTENQASLDKINDTVNEKLQKSLDDRISKSFEAVNKRLAEVYEGLGEMKNVASGVSDLKKVLSNVKTRGIMGEIQLGALLSEILSPEQYGEQVNVNDGKKVDFAVKIPSNDNDECVYLPIDSKFPGDTYSNLVEAYESGNSELIKEKRSFLISEMKRCAKSIHDKYICPPYTTDFAIMFLPFEGLYAEAVNLGLVEVLQREYRVNIAGPSTMGAMLNSLQMGFRTLAIQKKSSEVWKILESAKKEFGNFEDVLNKTRDRLRQADEELCKLIGTRTNKINSALKNITVIDYNE